MTVAARIERKLREAFAPESLELVDESEKHRGHGGWREGGETHFHLRMTAPAFAGQSRVARQRAVNKALAEELAGPVHALAMELRAPGEG
ncbi:BolA family transcriptional regulator [Limibaculum sp. FT325]|uniref:BolA family protein n=1 Tax=Thermohalobaculum sediminis TaxID=2939436 RepID=UPI0020C0D633|nr:BolA family protein [Limibaculum sediminis]MCL5777586.1 BolA family transcriptional regulator [Limibaculum sediminis]